MLKILVLEHPRVRSEIRFNDIANTPLWSCLMGGYAASALQKAGYSVEYWNAASENRDFVNVREAILTDPPELLAINAVYMWENTGCLFAFLRDLKQAGFPGHIHLFGFYPTLAYQRILEFSREVNSISVGECEITVTELAGRIAAKETLEGIPGLAHWSLPGDEIRLIPRKPAPNPDRFLYPLRDPDSSGTASILGSRGCYNHCRFCPIPSFYNGGPLWRGRHPEHIVAEIQSLMAAGYRDFYFVDPNFIGPGKSGRSRTLDLMKQIRPLGIRFGMETRPNDLDAEIMESLVSAGCNSLLLGIESGSDRILGQLSKTSAAEAGSQAIELCRRVGIEPEIGFLMFVPDSTVFDLKANLRFLYDNCLLDRLDRTANLLSHCQIVLMGTSGYRKYEAEGRLTPAGYQGFEGEIRYLDDRVAWIRDRMVSICRDVLQESSLSSSPLYWKRPQSEGIPKETNNQLVRLFETLLEVH
jgi:radical SAM superfamily enzyme YgiQ (UPF0313 family)